MGSVDRGGGSLGNHRPGSYIVPLVVKCYTTLAQVPTFTGNGASRALPWVFEKPSVGSSKLMSVLLAPMSQSLTFKKFGVGPLAEEEARKEKVKKESEVIRDMVHSKIKDGGFSSQSSNRKRKEITDMTEDEDFGGGIGQEEKCDPKQANVKLNKKSIKSQFAGFTAEEKDQYSDIVQNPADPMEFRVKTALDEALGALTWKASQIRNESRQKLQTSDLSAKAQRQMIESEEAALTSTISFCISIFIEFVFAGSVNLNGSQFRAYTSLRSELQGVLGSAHAAYVTQLASQFDPRRNTETTSGQAQVDALSLAQMLCNELASKPVTSMVWDEEAEEDKAHVGVATIMAMNFNDLVIPLQAFVKNSLNMPVLMHDFPRAFLLQLRGENLQWICWQC